jgi:ankyrin repeat protein
MRTLKQLFDEIDRAGVFFDVKVDSVHSGRISGETAIHIFAKWDDAEAIQILVANGADINKAGEDDNTPLHYAAMLGRLSATKALVALGAANARDRYGNLPIDLAFEHPEVKEFLESNGYSS